MLKFILLSGLLFHASHAYPTGAPPQACENMTPSHSENQPKPGQAPVQLKVDVKPSDNQRESELTIDLISPAGTSPGFKGFLIQVRTESNKIVGQWESSSPDVKFVDCDGPKSAATHTNNNQKKQVSLKWKGTTETGNVIVTYTIVESYPVFWVQQKSETIDIRKPNSYTIPNTGASPDNNNATGSNTSESVSPNGPNRPASPGQPNPFGPQSGQPNQPGQQPGQPNPFGPQSGQNQPGQQPGQPNPFGSQPGQDNQPGQPGQPNQSGQPGNQPGQFGQPGNRPGQPDQSGRPFDPNGPEMRPSDQENPGSGPPGSRPGQGGDGMQVHMNASVTGPPYQVDRPTNGQHDGNGQHDFPGMGGDTSTELNNFFGAENFQTTRRPGETARNQQTNSNSGNHLTVSLFLIAIVFFMLEVVWRL